MAVFPRESVASIAPRYTSVLPLPVTPWSRPAANSPDQKPAPDFGERYFLFGVQHVRGRDEIRVPRIFAGRERFFPGDEHARFFKAARDGARGVRFFQQQRQREGAARGCEHFANSLFGRAGKQLRGARAPRDDLLHARLPLAQHLASGEVAEAHEFFGGGFVYSPSARARGGAVNLPKKREFGLFLIRHLDGSGEIAKVSAAGIGERMLAVVTQLDFRRQHGTKCFANGREIVSADPVPEFEELWRQRGKGIHHLGDFFYARNVRRAVGFREAHADHRAPAEGNDDAAANERFAIQ